MRKRSIVACLRVCAIALVVLVASASFATGICKKCDDAPDATTGAPNRVCGDVPHMDPNGGQMECTESQVLWKTEDYYCAFIYDPGTECYTRCVGDPMQDSQWCKENCYSVCTRRYYKTECTLSGSFCGTYDPDDTGDGSPIAFKLDSGPWSFSNAEAGVPFDLYGDGNVARWSWPTDGIAWLALDRGVPDGAISSGRELFGNATTLRDGSRAENGFEALKDLDDNEDGFIDGYDAAFPYLQLWRDDADRDGVSQSHELTPVVSHQVEWISTDYNTTARVDQNGNYFRFMGHAKIDGRVVPIYDVYLKSTPLPPTP